METVTYKKHPKHQHLMIGDNGSVYSLKSIRGGFLNGGLNKDGYLRVRTSRDSKSFIHVLVAECFIGPRFEKITVNHKNGVKSDNRISNLEYLTNRENVIHSYRELGRTGAQGQRNGSAKLKDEDVLKIIALHRTGMTRKEIALKYNVSVSPIDKVINNRTFKHIKR